MDDDEDDDEGGSGGGSVGPSPPPPPCPIDHRSHLLSILALCLCTLTHSYLLISVFPYSGFMAMSLVPSSTTDNAGTYAGLISSSFMFGRAFSSYPWGQAADLYGRKAVLRVSLVMSGVATIWFGLSRTLPCALIARFVLGLSNGMPGTAKTLASELALGNSELETRGMGLVFSMWGVGFLLSPAVGGWLAEPIQQYPNAEWVHWGWLEPVLVRYPFLLPNLVGMACCAVSWVGVTCLIEETLPKESRRELRYVCGDLGRGLWGIGRSMFVKFDAKPSEGHGGETMPLLSSTKQCTSTSNSKGKAVIPESSAIRPVCIEEEEVSNSSDGSSGSTRAQQSSARSNLSDDDTATEEGGDESLSRASIASLWKRKRTRSHLTSYWLYSFVIICIDESFPLFCMSRGGGLGISEATIGKVLSTSGLIFATLQYIIYAAVVDRWGVYPALKVGGLVSVLLVLPIPLSVPLNDATAASSLGKLSTSTFVFLSVIMATVRIFSMIFQSCITIATNSTVPATHRATMNGLSMLGGSFAKGIGPAFAGWLVSYSLSSGIVDPMRWGSVLIFGVIGGLGLAVSVYTFCALGPG